MTRRTAKERTNGNAKPIIETSYGLVCAMEKDVTIVGDVADAIAMLAETLSEPEDSRVVQRLAWMIKTHCDAIKTQRGNLFHLLHPNRAGRKEAKAG